MAIDRVLAVIPVSDIDAAAEWYEALFGRPPTNRPMDTLVEWNMTGGGWVQVFVDEKRAGSSMLNLTVSDLAQDLESLRERGLSTESIVEANKGVRLSSIDDPDGNRITLIGNFRERY